MIVNCITGSGLDRYFDCLQTTAAAVGRDNSTWEILLFDT
jgi:hypothetical protein